MNAIRLAPRDTSFENPDRADSSFTDYASSLVYDALYHSPVSAVHRLSESFIERNYGDGRKISPEEASQTYGLEGELTFDSPVYESYAQLLQDRKLAEHRREFELQSRSEKHWSRGISGFGVSLVAQALDPVNLASMFIPIVGEERMLSGAKHAGSFLSRGLMSPKTVVGFTGNNRFAYRAAKGAISGIAGAALVEPFNLLAALDEQAHYGFEDSAMNLLFSGILGAGIPSVGGHFADKFKAAHLAIKDLDPQTHESAVMSAVSDIVQDKSVTSPADIISVDQTVVTRELQSTNSRNILSIAEEHLNRLEELYLQGRTTPEMEARRKLIGGILRNPNSATLENLAAMFNLKIDEAVAAVPEIFRHVDPETYKRLPKEVQDLITTDRGSQPGATSPEDIGLVKQKGSLGKKGYFTTDDPRFTGLSVQIEDTKITLLNIEVAEQGKGTGTEMLNKLKQLSNSLNKKLVLIPEALDVRNQARLEKFYKNLGFVPEGNFDFVYYPKPSEAVPQVSPAQVREATVKKVKEIATKKAQPVKQAKPASDIPAKAEPIPWKITEEERRKTIAAMQAEVDSWEQDMNLTPEEKGTFDEVVDAIEKWSEKKLKEGRKKMNMGLDPEQLAAGAGFLTAKALKGIKGVVKSLSEIQYSPENSGSGRGWFILPRGEIIDITREFGGGTNDHPGIFMMLENAKALGVPQEILDKINRYNELNDSIVKGKQPDSVWDEADTLFTEVMDPLWRMFFNGGGIRVREFGTTKGRPYVAIEGNISLAQIQRLIGEERIPSIPNAEYNVDSLKQRISFTTDLRTLLSANKWRDIDRSLIPRIEPQVAQEAALKIVTKEMEKVKKANPTEPKAKKTTVKFDEGKFSSFMHQIEYFHENWLKNNDYNEGDAFDNELPSTFIRENPDQFKKVVKILAKAGYDILDNSIEKEMGGSSIAFMMPDKVVKLTIQPAPEINLKGFTLTPEFESNRNSLFHVEVVDRVKVLSELTKDFSGKDAQGYVDTDMQGHLSTDLQQALDMLGAEYEFYFSDAHSGNFGLDSKGNLVLIDKGAIEDVDAGVSLEELWKDATPKAKQFFEKIKSQIEDAHKLAQENVEAKQLDKAKKGLEAGINCITKKII